MKKTTMNKNTEYNPLKAGNAIIDGIIGTVKGFVKTFIVLAINNIIYVF